MKVCHQWFKPIWMSRVEEGKQEGGCMEQGMGTPTEMEKHASEGCHIARPV